MRLIKDCSMLMFGIFALFGICNFIGWLISLNVYVSFAVFLIGVMGLFVFAVETMVRGIEERD